MSDDLFDQLVALDAAIAACPADAPLMDACLPVVASLVGADEVGLAGFDPATFEPVVQGAVPATAVMRLEAIIAAAALDGQFGLAARDPHAIPLDGPAYGEGTVLLHACASGGHFAGILVLCMPAGTAWAGRMAALALACARIAAADEARLLHAELTAHNQRLESAIAERTLDLAMARERAEGESLAKSKFLAEMSHEIRTPMTGVLGMAQVLAGTQLSPEQLDLVRTLQRSGESLLGLLNDVLDFSKIEAGRMELEQVAFDPAEIAYDVAALFRGRLSSPQVDLVVRCEAGLPARLLGDPLRVRQIIANLVGNAVKFTRQGHILLRVHQERGTLAIDVSDTGPGIDRDRQATLFTAYQQADASTARRHGGTGLGLAICRMLCRLMDGEITLDSVPGAGATFRARLPLPAADGPAPERPLAKLRILVADHAPLPRLALADALRALGASVVESGGASDAAASLAVAAMTGDRFDLAVVDLHLDGSADAGSAFAKRLSDEPDLGRPAVLLAAGTSPETPPPGFLLVPARPQALARAVLHALGRPVAEAAQNVRRWRGRVLVADDNPVNQRVFRLLLTQLGLEPEVVGDGQLAVARALRGGYALALIDLQMPGLDGWAAAEAIRTAELVNGLPRLPVYALTASPLAEDHQRALASGMDGVLLKPPRQDELHALLARHCSPA